MRNLVLNFQILDIKIKLFINILIVFNFILMPTIFRTRCRTHRNEFNGSTRVAWSSRYLFFDFYVGSGGPSERRGCRRRRL